MIVGERWSLGVSKEIFKSNTWRAFKKLNNIVTLIKHTFCCSYRFFLFNIFLPFFNYRTYTAENLQSVVSLLIDTVFDKI